MPNLSEVATLDAGTHSYILIEMLIFYFLSWSGLFMKETYNARVNVHTLRPIDGIMGHLSQVV